MARVRKQAARRVEERRGLQPKMACEAQLDPAWQSGHDRATEDRKPNPRAGRTGSLGTRAERPSEGSRENQEPARDRTPAPTS